MRPPRSFVPLMAQSVPSPIRYVPPLRHLFFSFWWSHTRRLCRSDKYSPTLLFPLCFVKPARPSISRMISSAQRTASDIAHLVAGSRAPPSYSHPAGLSSLGRHIGSLWPVDSATTRLTDHST